MNAMEQWPGSSTLYLYLFRLTNSNTMVGKLFGLPPVKYFIQPLMPLVMRISARLDWNIRIVFQPSLKLLDRSMCLSFYPKVASTSRPECSVSRMCGTFRRVQLRRGLILAPIAVMII